MDDEPRRSDERKLRPSLLDLAMIISVMALIAFLALARFGGQTSVILLNVSGSV